MLEGDTLWLGLIEVTITAVSNTHWQGRSKVRDTCYYGLIEDVAISDSGVLSTDVWAPLNIWIN